VEAREVTPVRRLNVSALSRATPGMPEATAARLGVRISLFFGALFLAYGVVVPYFPVWLDSRGLDPLQISTVTAAPLFLRLLVTPAIGLLADRLGNYRLVIVALAWGALALILGLSLVGGYAPILIIGVAFLLANGTMLPLIETIAVGGVRTAGLDYGRMRLWGSITFIVANFAGGVVIEALGGSAALWMIALAAVLTIAAAVALPPPPVSAQTASPPRTDWLSSSPARLLRSRLFILFLIAIGCTHGAHATFYTFGALHWQAQGLSAAWVGTLWAIGVIAEVVLFAFSAPVVRRFGPAELIVAGAFASVVRWGAMAFDPPLALLIPLQVLHALTYGAAHLGAILFITRAVPAKGMGSAQAFYSTIAAGLAMGIVGLISGALYARVGGEVYFVPALVAIIGCAAGVALLRGWNGRQLWADAEDAGVLSPTAPAKAS
jgi:PPP family 3-phenylpropionic acid transporter